MSYQTAKKNIRAHFVSLWGSTTLVQYENTPGFYSGNTLARSASDPPGDTYWARLQIINNFGEQASLGGPTVRYRQTGLVIVSLFAPENKATTVIDGYADTAIAIFRKPYCLLDTGERFRNASIQEIGVSDGWYQVQVRAEFTFDEIV